MARNTLATDDFNRADSSSLGSNWDGGYGDDDFRIVSNAGRPEDPTSGNGRGVYNALTVDDDQWGQVTVTALSPSTYSHFAVVLRGAATPTYTGYYCYLGRGGTSLAICKHVAGVFTELAYGSHTYSAGDELSAEVVGTRLELFINGVSDVTSTDSAIASGKPGVGFYGPSVTDGTVIFDDFSMGDFNVPTGMVHRALLLGVGT